MCFATFSVFFCEVRQPLTSCYLALTFIVDLYRVTHGGKTRDFTAVLGTPVFPLFSEADCAREPRLSVNISDKTLQLVRTVDLHLAGYMTVANVNVLLAGINLLPTSGLDGEAALSAVFDVASISKTAVNWLESGKRRRVLFHTGLPGYACLCVFGITLLTKLALWLIIAANAANILFNLF